MESVCSQSCVRCSRHLAETTKDQCRWASTSFAIKPVSSFIRTCCNKMTPTHRMSGFTRCLRVTFRLCNNIQQSRRRNNIQAWNVIFSSWFLILFFCAYHHDADSEFGNLRVPIRKTLSIVSAIRQKMRVQVFITWFSTRTWSMNSIVFLVCLWNPSVCLYGERMWILCTE